MSEEKLLLVPMPRHVDELNGTFAFDSEKQIVIQDAALFKIAQRLQHMLYKQAAISTEIVVGQIGEPGDVAAVLSVEPQAVAKKQGYFLDVKPDRVVVTGHDAAGVFYGICTLNQLIRQFGAEMPCLSIKDDPDFAARGVMLDISRCKVPKLETLKTFIGWLASLKINELQLYTEHTFAYREHKEVWVDASPITGQEILELDAYCRERFIELVPNQNSFGHMVPWLTHPKYAHLAEAPDGFDWPWGGHSDKPFSLCPTDPASLALLETLYDDLLPHFSSKKLNVGCDETFDVGVGRSKEACEEKGVHRVYLEFVRQIYQLVKKRGYTMMFWGDIIVREPDLIPELPQDAIALEWGYEFDHPFDKNCEHFAQSGIPFYVCPGTSSWNALVGRTDNAMGNLRNAAENGLKHGAVGYLNTNWGDNGHWQYQPTAYLGYTYGAAVSWAYQANAGIDLPSVLSLHAFQDPTGTMGRVAFDLGNVYKIYERFTGQRVHNANFLVRVLGMPVDELGAYGVDWKQIPPEIFRQANQAIDAVMAQIAKARMQGPDADLIRREYENAARLLRHACVLGELKINLAFFKEAEGQEAQALKSAVVRQAGLLAEDMRAILAEHRFLWLARNRLGGLEKNSAKHFQKMVDTYRRLQDGEF